MVKKSKKNDDKNLLKLALITAIITLIEKNNKSHHQTNRYFRGE